MGTIFSEYERVSAGKNKRLRQAALDIVEEGIRKVIPYEAVRRLISFDGKTIRIGDREISMDTVRHIYVTGAGKGSFPIAQALDEIFGERIRKGFVAVKEGEKRRLEHIEIFESSHPIPDERSVEAADQVLAILKEAGERDLIFAAVTGGSSALLNKPAGNITIDHLRELNTKLLNCGAEIGKINTVRKHICLLKGGRLVKYGQPATVVTLTFDTAPPDMPWPDLCLPDPTTFSEAIGVLKDYRLWEDIPESIRAYLCQGENRPELETVKSLENMKQFIFSVADPRTACEAAAEGAKQRGYEPHILSTIMEGEAKDVGVVMAGITDEILAYGRPFAAPCALISGGETTVTIAGEHGMGGPNQETVLGFADKIRHRKGYVFVSIDTDGTDGPCDKAGGIVDGDTLRKAEQKGICIRQGIYGHDSARVLEELGDDIITGHTGTNVMNLRVVLIDEEGTDGEDR
jgi:glycerate-2-kinase